MKKFVVFLLTAMLIFSFSFSAMAATTGTPISSLNDLKSLNGAKKGTFYLTKDITIPKNSDFSPIENFNATFDGNGKKIINLNIKVDGENTETYGGLFATIGASGNVSDLTLENVTIECTSKKDKSYIKVGAIAGENGGTINNCRVSGTISVNAPLSTVYVGGIVGFNEKRIKHLENFANIEATGAAVYAGGIVGAYTKNAGKPLEECINHGHLNVSGEKSTSYGGGIVGRSSMEVRNCANYGDVFVYSDVDAFAAGIAGTLTDKDYVTKCFSAGKISCNSSARQFWDAVFATEEAGYENLAMSCYYLENSVSGKSVGEIKTATALSAEAAKQSDSFSNFVFNDTWKMVDGKLALKGITAAKPVVTTVENPNNPNGSQGGSQGGSQDGSQGGGTQGTTSGSAGNTTSGSAGGSADGTVSGDEYIPPIDLNSSTIGGSNETESSPAGIGDFTPKKALPIWLFAILAVAAAAGVCVFLYTYKKKN